MLRFTFILLVTGLFTIESQAQTAPKNTSTSTTKKTAKADDWGWDTPSTSTKAKASANTNNATATETAPAGTTTDAANPAQSTGSDAAAGGFGGFGGAAGYGGGGSSTREAGMSVAPGRPLLPASRTRSDYMGRPIKSKPSMRPRSVDYEKVDLLNATPAQ